MTTDFARELWESDEWRQRRSTARQLAEWYEGRPLDETEPIRDPETGTMLKRYPLRLNTPQLACDVHRDMTRGKIGEDILFLRAKVSRKNKIVGKKADLIEELINDGVWRPSRGGTLLNEAILSANIYGGVFFKLSWEPWRRDLPYGLAIRSINTALVYPEWDPVDRWRFSELWYGHEISAKDAKLRYKVDTGGTADVLYMEHWTQNGFTITVNGQVPKMQRFPGDEEGYPLDGENKWDFIPFYYAPHERATGPWGRSQIEGSQELCREINARLVNISDYFRGLRGDIVYGTDIKGTLRVTEVDLGGSVLKIVDVGQTPPMPNAKSPALHAMPSPDIPPTYAQHPDRLGEWDMKFNRLSPSLFGMDDVQGGRITGVAVAQRMWTTTAHTDTERLYMGTAKTVIDTDVVRLFGMEPFKEDLKALIEGRKSDLQVPDIDEQDGYGVIITQSWPDPLPLDKEVQHRIMTDKFRAGVMSIDSYLRADGVTDIDDEKKRIKQWKQVTKPAPFGGSDGNRDGDQDQGADQRREDDEPDHRAVPKT